MKRLVIALVMVSLIASVSLGATKKYLPTPTSAPAPVSSSSNSGPNFPTVSAIGLECQGAFFLPFSIATLRFDLNRKSALEFGVGSTKIGGTGSDMILMSRYESDLTTKNSIRTYWGGVLTIISASTSTTMLSGIVGAELLINNQLGVYGDINVLSLTSADGTTDIGLGLGSNLFAGGVRVYL